MISDHYTNAISNILDLYVRITKGEPIAKIGPPYTFYYADYNKTDIIIKDVISIDIKSAFPTICSILFGKDHDFVKGIYSRTDKKQRNIFISTTLTDWSNKTGYKYLDDITLLSKALIFSYVFTHFNNIQILEYIKDGMIIYGNKNYDFTEDQNKFIEFEKQNSLICHEDSVNIYMRMNKTTISALPGNMKIKGIYNGMPLAIYQIIEKFFSGMIYHEELLSTIQKFYSTKYFNIIYHGGIKDYIDYLYKFDSDKYLNDNGEFTSSLSQINPKSYLYKIIYPILTLLRIYQTQK